MTTYTYLGLCCELLAVLLVLAPLRASRAGFLGGIFIIVAFVYHGVGEVAQHVFPTQGGYRIVIGQPLIDRWLPVVGSAFLAFAVVYAGTLQLARPIRKWVGKDGAAWWPSTRLMVGIAAALWIVSVGGVTVAPGLLYWGDGIVGQFLVIAASVAVILYVRTASQSRVFAALLMQALALALVGTRFEAIAATVAVVWASSVLNRAIPRRTLLALGSIVVLLAMLVSAARLEVGRRTLEAATLPGRIAAYEQGASGLASGRTSGVAGDFVYRFDGNAWPALVVERRTTYGAPPLLPGLKYDFRLAIPHFLYAAKLDTPVWQRSEELYLDYHLGINNESTIVPGFDWLPTVFGSAYSFLGWQGLLLFAALLGFTLARLDLAMHRSVTFPKVLVGVGAVVAITYYERGFDSIIMTARGVLVVWVAARLVDSVARALRRVAAWPPLRGGVAAPP